jgi:hypothetical protein
MKRKKVRSTFKKAKQGFRAQAKASKGSRPGRGGARS